MIKKTFRVLNAEIYRLTRDDKRDRLTALNVQRNRAEKDRRKIKGHSECEGRREAPGATAAAKRKERGDTHFHRTLRFRFPPMCRAHG